MPNGEGGIVVCLSITTMFGCVDSFRFAPGGVNCHRDEDG